MNSYMAEKNPVFIDKTLHKALKEYCKKHGHMLTWIVTKIVAEFLEQNNEKEKLACQ